MQAIRVLTFRTWEELKETAMKMADKGFRCEVIGWEDMSANRLTVYDEWEDE